MKPLLHQGHSYVRGDYISLPAIEAAALAQSGFVTLTKGAVIMRDPEPEPVLVRKRRTYRRRDLVAEETAELTRE